MKAFVTGATGFLGSHLVDLLLQEGHEVRCLVRPTSDLRWLKGKRVQLVSGALQPKDAGLQKGLKEADWCFHLAGLISTARPQEYFTINAGGTRHCLDACLKAAPALKRFVLVSSIAASGPPKNSDWMDESISPQPLTDYGKSKLEGERIAMSYRDKLPVSIIRPPAIYGPRDKMILPIFKLAQKGLFMVPAGRPRYISMAYVEDVAGACLWAAKNEKAVGETFFVADGDVYPWQDMADCLAAIFYRRVHPIPLPKFLLMPAAFLEETRSRLFKQSPRIHRGHIRQFFCSWGIHIDKIRQAGFAPKFNLEAGMKATVAGYRQLGWL